MTAFPSTPILDTFSVNGGPPPDANWAGPQYVGDNEFKALGGVAVLAAGTAASDYYNALGALTAPLEVFFTVVTPDTAAGGFSRLDYCIQNPNTSSISSYRISNTYGGQSDLVRFERHDPGGTVNGQIVTIPGFWSAGNKVGVRLRADGVHEIWLDTGTGFKNVTTFNGNVDTTYTSGFIGMSGSTSVAHGNFGGGLAVLTPQIILPLSVTGGVTRG